MGCTTTTNHTGVVSGQCCLFCQILSRFHAPPMLFALTIGQQTNMRRHRLKQHSSTVRNNERSREAKPSNRDAKKKRCCTAYDAV